MQRWTDAEKAEHDSRLTTYRKLQANFLANGATKDEWDLLGWGDYAALAHRMEK